MNGMNYESPITEIWILTIEQNILSGENGSMESVTHGDDPFEGCNG